MSQYFSSIVVSLLLLSSVAHAEGSPQAAEKVEGRPEISDTTSKGTAPFGYAGGSMTSNVNPDLREKQAALQRSMDELIKKGIVTIDDGKTNIPDINSIEDGPTKKALEQFYKQRDAVANAMNIPNTVQNKDTDATKHKKPDNAAAISAELIDGQQVVLHENGYVSIVAERGRYITPPDGILTLKDGTTFNVRNGLRVDE